MSKRRKRRVPAHLQSGELSGCTRTKAALKPPQSRRRRVVLRAMGIAERLDCGGFSAAVISDELQFAATGASALWIAAGLSFR